MSNETETSPTSEDDVPTTPTDPPQPGRAARLWQRYRALSLANKLTFFGLVVACVPLVTPWVSAAYGKLTGDDVPLRLDAGQADDPCNSRWIVDRDRPDLLSKVGDMDDRALARWERDRRITHHRSVSGSVSMRGNAAAAVEIRDVSITVTRRTKPLAGKVSPPPGCGGPDLPEVLYVDLDTLPLNRAVPGSYLMSSPQQAQAREDTRAYNGREPMRLPRSITMKQAYSLMLVGRTQRYYSEWKATVTWWDGEETHTSAIDNDGAPFRVSAARR